MSGNPQKPSIDKEKVHPAVRLAQDEYNLLLRVRQLRNANQFGVYELLIENAQVKILRSK